jgi:hypothetical protein
MKLILLNLLSQCHLVTYSSLAHENLLQASWVPRAQGEIEFCGGDWRRIHFHCVFLVCLPCLLTRGMAVVPRETRGPTGDARG